MPLTHVCVWEEKTGYRPITIEEACLRFPNKVEANRGVFICELCSQNVGLTNEGMRVRHFRHSSAALDKECEDRAQIYEATRAKSNYHPLPIKIKVNSSNQFYLQLGFFKSSSGTPTCSKVYISHDLIEPYTYLTERFVSSGVSYLDVGDTPCPIYYLNYENPSSDLEQYWPKETDGINPQGAFFDLSTGKMLRTGGQAYINQHYYLLQSEPVSTHSRAGIDFELITQVKKGELTWYLYKIFVHQMNKESAHFFLKRSVHLTSKPLTFYPVWPPYVQDPYFIYHNDQEMFFFLQGVDSELHVYPEQNSPQYSALPEGRLYKIEPSSKDQLVALGKTGALGFSYLSHNNLDYQAELPTVKVTNANEETVDQNEFAELPKNKLLRIWASYDGKVVVLRDNLIREIHALRGNDLITIEDLALGCDIQIFQGSDLNRTIRFVNKQQQNDYRLLDQELVCKLKACHGNEFLAPHSLGSMLHALQNYPLTKQWLYSILRQGNMSRKAYLLLLSTINHIKRV